MPKAAESVDRVMEEPYRSGFVTVVGRPNVGKSTLVNRVVGSKVTITSSRPNTTRRVVRGVHHRAGAQAVFVDTPGLHRPRSELGRHLNSQIDEVLCDVDVVVALLDATAPLGPGDTLVLERAAESLGSSSRALEKLVVAVNKVDRAKPQEVVARLQKAHDLLEVPRDRGAEYFPISAATGSGVDALLDRVVSLLPEGPPYFPQDMVSDMPENFWVAELVREQILARVDDELPHSVACRVSEWEWPYVRVEIFVERESQKAIVIGKGGSVLKEVGAAVRQQLPPGAFVELFVKVEKHWQQDRDSIARLGY